MTKLKNWRINPSREGLIVQYTIAVSIIVFIGTAVPYLIIAAKYQTFFNPW